MPWRKGFTLIELLIVITIISILVGVLLAVVDMDFVIKSARDATIKATINKVALVVESQVAATGRVPQTTSNCNCEEIASCELLALLNDSTVNATKYNTTPEYGSSGWRLMELK